MHLYCQKCGTQCSDDEKYCHQCGTSLMRTEELAGSEYKEKVQGGTVYIILGWIFFALSLFFIPILFGAGTVIMGYLVKKSGRDTHGIVMMVLGVAGAILGMIIGAVIGAAAFLSGY